MIASPLDRKLDSALDKLLAGSSLSDAAGLNWSIASVEELLAPAVRLREQMPLMPVDPAVRARSTAAFAADVEHRRVDWIHRRRLRVQHHVKRKLPSSHPIAGTFLLLVALVVALVVGVVAAAAAQFSEPDSALYPLKRVSEDALLAVTSGGAARADLEISFARQRLREAGSMATHDRPSLAVSANRERYRQLERAGRTLISTSRHDAAWRKTVTRLESEETIPSTSVERALVSNKHPEAAASIRRDAEAFSALRAGIDKQLLPPEQPTPPKSA